MRVNRPHLESRESVFHLQSLSHGRISKKLIAVWNLSKTNIFHGLMKGQLIGRTVFDFSDLVFCCNED